jgi:hypothetical protein
MVVVIFFLRFAIKNLVISIKRLFLQPIKNLKQKNIERTLPNQDKKIA